MHKVSQLKDQVSSYENESQAMAKENAELKTKLDKVIMQQFASESDKLNTLALELDSKDDEIKTIIEEKSQEV